MKAVILVGGEATRLRPLTLNTPKAMVPVLNTPFLEHVIGYLSQHQIRDIILAQGYLTPPIESYFGDGRRFGVRLSYAVENSPLGTAGAVKNTAKYLDETFLVLNGDIFTDRDITAMLTFHRERKAKVTIALTPVDDPTSYGLIESNAEGRVGCFVEKPGRDEVTTNMINAGIYIIEPEVLAYIPPRVSFSFEHELFPQLLERGEPIYATPSPAYWIDIGTPDKYFQLHLDLLGDKSHRFTLGDKVQIGERSHIHPEAQITEPVVIGNSCTIKQGARLIGPVVIGPGSAIEEDTIIERSIIWQNARLGARAQVKNSIVAGGCRLEANSTIDGSVLGDNVTVLGGCKLEPGSRTWPGTVVASAT